LWGYIGDTTPHLCDPHPPHRFLRLFIGEQFAKYSREKIFNISKRPPPFFHQFNVYVKNSAKKKYFYIK
jgi:hypothetical protein